MKLRKLFALLMAAVMLLGMVPTAQAAVINCDHNWAWRWPNGQPANCREWKWSEKYCTKCGVGDGGFEQCGPCVPGSKTWVRPRGSNCQEYGVWEITCKYCGEWLEGREEPGPHKLSETIVEQPWCEVGGMKAIICSVCGEWQNNGTPLPPLGHNWSSWRWAHGAPSCNESGWQVRECQRCGRAEDRYVANGDHQWGEWTITRESTCTDMGRKTSTCKRCGERIAYNIPLVDHVYGEWQVVTAAGVGTPGVERRYCTYECGTYEEREIPALEADANVPGNVNPDGLTVTKSAPQGSHAGYYYPGEQVTFTITVTNNTGVELHDVEITDPIKGNNEDATVDRIPSMQPGVSATATLTYTTTEADAAFGTECFWNTAYATGYTADGTQVSGTSNTVEVHCVMPHGISLSKTVSGTPANGEYYVPGETICFIISMSNDTTYPLYCVTLTDPLCEDQYFHDEVNDMSYLYMDNLYNSEDNPLGFSQSARVAPTYVVTEADAEAGFVTNTAFVHYQTWYGENKTASASVTVKCGKAADVILEKIDMRGPANGEYYVPGETIKYGLTVRSTEDNPLQNIIIYDPLKGGDQVVFGPADSWVLGAGFDYTVTEADAQRGFISNTGHATFIYQNTGEEGMVYSNTLTLPCGPVKDAGLSSALSLTKSVTSTPANGSYYVPGETVTYELCVKNNGGPLENLDVSDWMWGEERAWVGTFATGEDVTYPVTHIVTDADARAKHVNNIASATAIDKDGYQISEYSNLVTVPCGFPEGDDPFGVLTGLEISKVVESLPLNGSYYTEGETVAYKITYTNTGEMPLMDVMIYDAMNGMNEIATAETLTPGESRVCWFNHTVTAEDVDRGYIANTAIGQFNVGGFANTASSGTVTVDTNGKHDIMIAYPFWPGEDSGFDPGVIDASKLRSSNDFCSRTITARDNASVSYDTHFCAEHADTQAALLTMSTAAVTPELQAQTAAYAVTMWRSEVEALYEKLCTAADPTAQMVVMTEYVRFLTETANYEAMLKLLYPDQPALVAQKIAAMWENKCIALCCEVHADAAARKDSLLSIVPAAGAAAVSCSCTVSAQANASKAVTLNYCPTHSFPFSMTDALLRGNDTAESWKMVRQIWSVELTNAYNKVYAKLGDNSAVARAEYSTLTQWLLAREAALTALYPDNPELVAQTMVKHIMDRVNDLCMTIQ